MAEPEVVLLMCGMLVFCTWLSCKNYVGTVVKLGVIPEVVPLNTFLLCGSHIIYFRIWCVIEAKW